MIAALAAALAAAAAYGVAAVLQAVAARRSSGLRVMTQPLYAAGLALDGLGWLASLLAVRRLPLFAVQSLLAGSLVVTVVLSRIFLQARLRRRDGMAIAVIVLSLAVLAFGAGDQPAQASPSGFGVGMLLGAVVMAVGAGLLYRRGNAAVLAVLAGLGYGGAALAARGAHGTARAGEPVASALGDLLWQPAVPALAVLAVVGAVAFARSLERGDVGRVTAVSWVVEIVVPGIAGLMLLGDAVRPEWAVPAVVAVLAAMTGCVVLALSPARETLGHM